MSDLSHQPAFAGEVSEWLYSMETKMRRDVIVGDHRVSILAEPKHDPRRPANVAGYSVRYKITRTDGRPVREGFVLVQSYELNVGTDLFSTAEAALDYGEAKAREDVSTF